jgi:hypothetical protein
MFKNLDKIKSFISELTSMAIMLLCLGITVQLLVGEPLLGWNVVANITKAVGSLGQSNFIGVVALLVLYTIFKNKK